MYYEMTVYGITIDSIAQRPIVILKDGKESNTVPIWINTMDAVSMAVELIGRDITFQAGRGDLMAALLEQTGMKVDRIFIEDLKDGVFSASVSFVRGEEMLSVTVKPCEALITAIKYNVPIMVAENVVEQASTHALSNEKIAQEYNERRFVDLLENLDPADMGKYPM